MIGCVYGLWTEPCHPQTIRAACAEKIAGGEGFAPSSRMCKLNCLATRLKLAIVACRFAHRLLLPRESRTGVSRRFCLLSIPYEGSHFDDWS